MGPLFTGYPVFINDSCLPKKIKTTDHLLISFNHQKASSTKLTAHSTLHVNARK